MSFQHCDPVVYNVTILAMSQLLYIHNLCVLKCRLRGVNSLLTVPFILDSNILVQTTNAAATGIYVSSRLIDDRLEWYCHVTKVSVWQWPSQVTTKSRITDYMFKSLTICECNIVLFVSKLGISTKVHSCSWPAFEVSLTEIVMLVLVSGHIHKNFLWACSKAIRVSIIINMGFEVQLRITLHAVQ